MKQSNALTSLGLVIALGIPSIGCVVRGSVSGPAVVVEEYDEEPPPPRVYVAPVRPGFVWIEGRYHRRGNRWVWVDGRYERTRANQVWVQGRWERRGRRHVWVEGRWQTGTRGAPPARDYRRDDRRRGR